MSRAAGPKSPILTWAGAAESGATPVSANPSVFAMDSAAGLGMDIKEAPDVRYG
jgi:hypothetical protein